MRRTCMSPVRILYSPAAAVNGANPDFKLLPAQYSLNPITSREVDLNQDSRTANGEALSSDSGLPNDNHGSQPAAPPTAAPKPSRIVKGVKSPVPMDERKGHPGEQHSTQLQAPASPPQPEIPTSAGAPRFASQQPATISEQPNTVSEPAVEPAVAVSQPKVGGDATKTPELYVEVGTFKDETWANNAVDKLAQMGFHAVVIHKNLLWLQSYRVQVGPYTNPKDITEAQQSLSSQGFKAHPVK